jgi:hypothetical protein
MSRVLNFLFGTNDKGVAFVLFAAGPMALRLTAIGVLAQSTQADELPRQPQIVTCVASIQPSAPDKSNFVTTGKQVSLYVSTQPKPAEQVAPDTFWYAVWKQVLGSSIGGIISGLVTFVVLFILVYIYQRQFERQKLLHELSKEFDKITSKRCVTNLEKVGFKKDVKYIFTIALTREVPWVTTTTPIYDFSTPDRLLVFADKRALISSSVLHEAFAWFRRIHRAKKVKLLKNGDIYEMWRQVLPFVTDGRYTFLKNYWKQEDVTPILRVAGYVVRHCKKKNLKAPIDYLKGDAGTLKARVDSDFVEDLPEDIQSYVKEKIGL